MTSYEFVNLATFLMEEDQGGPAPSLTGFPNLAPDSPDAQTA
jgi:hypothetical protein